ncbi:MAG: choice-of-anchor B family protein [Bacteroidia bacterium]|nr:choice-of-anchor B family protein [Bacteroidia bacterium]
MNIRGGIFFVLAMLGFCFSAFSQLGLSLVSQLDYPQEANDIWGYVDPNGKEYALLGLTNGVAIIGLDNPSNPVELHFIPGATSVWRDLKTYSHYAYVSNETGNGTLIIDLAGLPGSIVYKDTVLAGINTAHNLWIDGDQLYEVGTNNNGGGMARFDLGPDPWRPQLAGVYSERYVHDVYVRNDVAYAAEISAGFLTIIDWTVPATPVVLSTTEYPNSFTHNTWLNDAGDVCFTTDEIEAGYIYSWDVSDPFNPVQLDGIRSLLSEGQAIPHNVHVKDDFLITSYYRDGVQIVDASRPGNLIEVGHYDTNPLDGAGFNGDWGAYPFLPSGLLLLSDIEAGLFVLQPSYQRACYLEGMVRDAATNAPIANVVVDILGLYNEDQSRTNGDYAVGTAIAGTYEVEFSRYGYLTDTITATLSNGVLTIVDVDLVPLNRVPLSIVVKDAVTLQPIGGAQVRLIAPNNEAEFYYQTISNGQAQDAYFVINDYFLIVGKWGYLSQGGNIAIDSSAYQLEYLLQPGYADDFSLDLGWKVSGNAERGIWERGEPIGTYRENGDIYNPEFDLPFDLWDECYMTGNLGDNPVGDDVDLGFTLLSSPKMDLSGYQEPVITYFYWFLNWSLLDGGRPANDFLAVSITDGIDTFEIKRYIGPFDTLWNYESTFYFQKYFPDLNREFQVLFYTQDFERGNADIVEAAIDGFKVIESAPTAIQSQLGAGNWRVGNSAAGELLLHWKDLPLDCVVNVSDLHGRLLTSIPLEGQSGSGAFPLSLPGGIYVVSLTKSGQILEAKKWQHPGW